MPHINLALLSQTLTSEIADMVAGGLEEIGHTTTTQMFTLDPGAMNIVMPAIFCPPERLDAIPVGTIFYNVEDLEHQPADKQARILSILDRGFAVWDYSRKNLSWYAAAGYPGRVRHVGLGYARRLDRIARRPWEERDLDVLFYGVLTQRRVDIIGRLMRTRLTVGVFHHIYGDLRDELISRSKVVMNVPACASFVAECPRVTFVAANGRLCVSEQPQYALDPGWSDAVVYVPHEEIVATCEALAGDRDAALARELLAHDAMRSLPMAANLRAALAATSATAP
jgi:hypothetical protein